MDRMVCSSSNRRTNRCGIVKTRQIRYSVVRPTVACVTQTIYWLQQCHRLPNLMHPPCRTLTISLPFPLKSKWSIRQIDCGQIKSTQFFCHPLISIIIIFHQFFFLMLLYFYYHYIKLYDYVFPQFPMQNKVNKKKRIQEISKDT